MRYLLIAEKPSLMREIEACYGRHRKEIESEIGELSFMSFHGHACRNAEPDEYDEWKGKKWAEVSYPMIPDEWRVMAGKDKKTLSELIKAAKAADGIIVATDSDTEGYGIYHLFETYCGLEYKPTLRFMEHSLTDTEILSSLLAMTNYHTDPAHVAAKDSFLVRSRADWLFGMNMTRMVTDRCGELMRVGRVKAPTIRLVYDNSMKIDGFVPERYRVVVADYGDFKGVLSGDDGKETRLGPDAAVPEYPLAGAVEDVETKRKRTAPPKLFDLTTAQAEAGRLFGLAPSRTLDIIQSLYEKHKAVSYPRTQCKYVSSEKAKEFPALIRTAAAFSGLKAIADAVDDAGYARAEKNAVNDAEVAKESHDALLPTGTPPDTSAMTEEEREVCRMIYARFLCQFLPDAEEDVTTAKIRHGDGTFIARGRTIVERGWRVLHTDVKEAFLPPLKKGQGVTAEAIRPEERQTKAPDRLTQHSLIHAMENIAEQLADPELKRSLAGSKGIGTPATRAGIISEIIKSGYVEEKRKHLYITELGKRYIGALSGIGIDSPEFAAVMDTRIKKVQRGEAEYSGTYDEVLGALRDMCARAERIEAPEGGGVAACPCCGGKIAVTGKGAFCGCGFKAFRTAYGAKLSDAQLKSLLADGETGTINTFVSRKTGKKYSGSLYVDRDGKAVKLRLPETPKGVTCPVCKERELAFNSGGAFCECGLKIFRNTRGGSLTDGDIMDLVNGGKTKDLAFKSKAGKRYRGHLYLSDEGTVEFEFAEEK